MQSGLESPPCPRELSLVLGAVAGLADVVGGALVAGRRHWDRTFLQYFLALGAGFMLAVAFLRMVPESLEKGSHVYLYVLIGYFLVHLTEHTLTPHFHFGEEVHHDALVHPAVGYIGLAGLCIHTFFDGVAIASGFLVSPPLGFILFAAVLLHKLPEGFAVASLMLASGGSRRAALLASGVLGLATMAGTLFMTAFTGIRGAGAGALGGRHDLRGGVRPDPGGQQGAQLGGRPGRLRGRAPLLRRRVGAGGHRPPRPLTAIPARDRARAGRVRLQGLPRAPRQPASSRWRTSRSRSVTASS